MLYSLSSIILFYLFPYPPDLQESGEGGNALGKQLLYVLDNLNIKQICKPDNLKLFKLYN